MNTIAIGLENGNPFAYLFLIILFLPPVMLIAMDVIEKIINKFKK